MAAALAPLAAPLLEAGGAGAAAGAEGGLMSGGLGGLMGNHPFLMGNLMGRAMSGTGAPGQAQMGPSPDASIAEPMGVTGKIGADMFGEDEIGMATQNRGENSDPDAASSTGIEGEAEHGDSPEQNKDTELGGGSKSPFAADDLENQGGGDNELRDTASNAFHSNLPLVIEFTFSEESGENHPILKALDELLESAFPGYKDTVGPEDPENPTEKLEGDLGQDLDGDGPADTPESKEEDEDEGDSKKESKKIAREAGYCWQCWGPLDVLKRCASCKTESARIPSKEEFGQFMNWQGMDAAKNEFGTAIRSIPGDVKQTVGEMFGRGTPPCPGCGETHGPGECPSGTIAHKRQADVPGPPSSTGMGYAQDPGAMTNITGIPTCPLCHQNHVAGTPCPTPQMQAPMPQGQISPAAQNFGVPMQNNKVVTRVAHDDLGVCPACDRSDAVGHSGYQEYSNRAIMECGHCGAGWDRDDPQLTVMEHPSMLLDESEARAVHQKYVGDAEPFDPEGRYSKFTPVHVAEYNADEIDREPQDPMHNESYEDGETGDHGWYEDWQGPDKGDEKHPWVDDSGEPLQEGGTYEMHSTGYVVPDKIKVLAVTPNKLTYELEAGDIAYKDTITTDDVYKQGYTFKPGTTDDDPGMESQQPPQREPVELAHPKPPRPGDDALPQQDDLSSPPTRVSHEGPPWGQRGLHDDFAERYPHARDMDNQSPIEDEEETGEVCPYCMRRDPSVAEFGQCIHCKRNNDMEDEGHVYLGSYQGDDPDSRNWLNNPGPGQGVDVDPITMAKIAGKEYSPREQRQFVEEQGTARNLHRLNLEGTHYELDDYEDSLW